MVMDMGIVPFMGTNSYNLFTDCDCVCGVGFFYNSRYCSLAGFEMMQIYSFVINNQTHRLYGKILHEVKNKNSKYTIYEDSKGLKWLHIDISSGHALVPWVNHGVGKEETYIKLLLGG